MLNRWMLKSRKPTFQHSVLAHMVCVCIFEVFPVYENTCSATTFQLVLAYLLHQSGSALEVKNGTTADGYITGVCV